MNRFVTWATFLAGVACAIVFVSLLHGCRARPDAFGWPAGWRQTARPEPSPRFARTPQAERLLVCIPSESSVILTARATPGEETLALYALEPEGLRLRAGRRITWDLHGYDYAASGRGLRVAEAERIIRDALEKRRNPFGLVDRHNDWLRRQAELAAEREAREKAEAEERQRLFEGATEGR